jgi:hypothetical protein
MPKKSREMRIFKLTENRGALKPEVKVFDGVGEFSGSFKFCYFNGNSLEKVKGGIGHGANGNRGSGGNYVGVDDGESYLVYHVKK